MSANALAIAPRDDGDRTRDREAKARERERDSVEKKRKIVKSLRAGNHETVACKSAGLGARAYKDWVAGDSDFRDECERACAECEIEWGDNVKSKEKDSDIKRWQWLLERRFMGRWGRSENMRTEGLGVAEKIGESDELMREVQAVAAARLGR
mgnify:CR=1 FL=1